MRGPWAGVQQGWVQGRGETVGSVFRHRRRLGRTEQEAASGWLVICYCWCCWFAIPKMLHTVVHCKLMRTSHRRFWRTTTCYAVGHEMEVTISYCAKQLPLFCCHRFSVWSDFLFFDFFFDQMQRNRLQAAYRTEMCTVVVAILASLRCCIAMPFFITFFSYDYLFW